MPPLILLVDGDADQHQIVGDFLSYQGYEVAHASSYADADRQSTIRIPGFIIAEWNLPDSWGGDGVRRLVAAERLLRVPIIVCTADAVTNPTRLARFAGVRMWCVKPCTPTAVYEIVRGIVPTE